MAYIAVLDCQRVYLIQLIIFPWFVIFFPSKIAHRTRVWPGRTQQPSTHWKIPRPHGTNERYFYQ